MKDEDANRRKVIDLKNEGDNAIHNTEKILSEHKDKLPSSLVDEINMEMNNLRNELNESNTDGDKIETAVNNLK